MRNLQKIQENIITGADKYFGYSHFDASNMADYTLMSATISDMAAVYDISESEAGEIITNLTH